MSHDPLPMAPALRAAALQLLWPDGAQRAGSVWAVLDCARDPAIYRALLESRLEFRCLYSGSLPRALEMNAPHLVELFPEHRLTARLLDAWGQSWGVFLQVNDAANLRHHLRKFLKVQDEQGRSLLFRYYDPRVLPTFLRSCDAAQLRLLFGDVVQAWLAETGDGLLALSLQGGRLRERSALVPA